MYFDEFIIKTIHTCDIYKECYYYEENCSMGKLHKV